jgi:aryl-alcohol dehydrogenase-like predicted oxidoreductase
MEHLCRAAELSRGLGARAFSSVQVEWSLADRTVEAGIRAYAAELGVCVLPYYPLAGGLLAGKVTPAGEISATSRLHNPRYARFLSQGNLDLVSRLTTWAEAHGRSLLEIALGWLAAQPSVGCVIAGASTPEQVQQNVRATSVQLTAEEIQAIDELTAPPTPVPPQGSR